MYLDTGKLGKDINASSLSLNAEFAVENEMNKKAIVVYLIAIFSALIWKGA